MKGGFRVQSKQCATCIYRKDSPIDLAKLEAQVADPHGGFRGHRICHHSHDVCCRGFWDRHKDEFPAGQVAQRLGAVRFVHVDNMEGDVMYESDSMDAINFANEWVGLGDCIQRQVEHICTFSIEDINPDEVTPNGIKAAKESGLYGLNAEIDEAIDEYLKAHEEGRLPEEEDDDDYVGNPAKDGAAAARADDAQRKKSVRLDIDFDDDEYLVAWIENGRMDGAKTYYTDHLDDAIATRADMQKRAESNGYAVTLTESISIVIGKEDD